MLDWSALSNILGNIVQVIAICGTGLAMFFAMRSKLEILGHDVKRIEQGQSALSEAFKQLGSILTQVAVQDTRLAMLEKNLDELRHGIGYINGKE